MTKQGTSGRRRRTLGRILACALAALALTGGPPAFADDDDDDDDDACVIEFLWYGSVRTIDLNDLSWLWNLIKRQLHRSRIQPTNTPEVDPVDASATAQLLQIAAPLAHLDATGDGVVVAVLDGGFLLGHDDLAGRLSTNDYDAVSQDNDPEDAGDGVDNDGDGVVDNAVGHGTFVAGLILQAAPDATIMPIRVVDAEGYGSIDALLRGLDHAIDEEVDVINLSLEAGALSDPRVRDRLEDAYDDGIVLVAAAGNDGDDDVGYLASNVHTLSVGAVDADDDLASFSNGHCSDELDVYAPGVDLYGPYGDPDDDTMATWSGTSFSAAFVSGAVALYLELNPSATPAAVHTAIQASTDPISGCADHGRINLAKVVD